MKISSLNNAHILFSESTVVLKMSVTKWCYYVCVQRHTHMLHNIFIMFVFKDTHTHVAQNFVVKTKSSFRVRKQQELFTTGPISRMLFSPIRLVVQLFGMNLKQKSWTKRMELWGQVGVDCKSDLKNCFRQLKRHQHLSPSIEN